MNICAIRTLQQPSGGYSQALEKPLGHEAKEVFAFTVPEGVERMTIELPICEYCGCYFEEDES